MAGGARSMKSKATPGVVVSAAVPIARPLPLREAVIDRLVEMIVNGELKPGQHLGEAELAQQLGVSRQPVREALQQMSAEGWVDLMAGQGAFVHEPTAKEADNLLAVRTLLDAEAARLAATQRTEDQVAHLWELWKVGMAAVQAKDVERIVKANAELHAYITEMADNPVLAQLSRSVQRRVSWYFTPIARKRSKDSWDEHAELIRVIESGDAARAGEVMAVHTERTRGVKRPGLVK